MLSRKFRGAYTFKPTFTSYTGSKYRFLTEHYEPLVKKFVRGKLNGDKNIFDSEEESTLFYLGIEEIEGYIYNGFFYFVKSDSGKDNVAKIISSIYYRLTKFFGSEENARDEVKGDILDLAKDSVFYALGIDRFNNRNFVWDYDQTERTFIKHTFDNVFKVIVLEYMKTKAELLDIGLTIEVEEDISNTGDSLNAEDILKKSGLDHLIPVHVKEDILEYLNGQNFEGERMEMIKKYLEKVYEAINKS